MSHIPHTLHDEFPDQAGAIHQLKLTDAHFAKQAVQFDELAHQIHRAETNIEPMSDFALEDLKKRRLLLKDALAATLAKG